jgi:hypothetical protein
MIPKRTLSDAIDIINRIIISPRDDLAMKKLKRFIDGVVNHEEKAVVKIIYDAVNGADAADIVAQSKNILDRYYLNKNAIASAKVALCLCGYWFEELEFSISAFEKNKDVTLGKELIIESMAFGQTNKAQTIAKQIDRIEPGFLEIFNKRHLSNVDEFWSEEKAEESVKNLSSLYREILGNKWRRNAAFSIAKENGEDGEFSKFIIIKIKIPCYHDDDVKEIVDVNYKFYEKCSGECSDNVIAYAQMVGQENFSRIRMSH